ncbi:MAG: nickel pincer cofactor biosynthesis protein LarC [Zoogloeaceae bacterium]|jgi:uncharacterized protein (TIGR00299 family) protein|nr:nickel pincer cofactor biosynthesis protein LarC [Zoogloeaceae bacterium]
MKTLYLECAMGAAGDMLMAALYELLADDAKASFLQTLNALGLPDARVAVEPATRCGITGTRFAVRIGGQEEHEPQAAFAPSRHPRHAPTTGLGEIESLLSRLPVSASVRTHAAQVYRLIAEAESAAHGCPVGQIHFHEVGQMDAVVDIVGVAILLERLAPERIVASAIHVGKGQVNTAHGILPVPAPATLRLLEGIPAYGGAIDGELCTPTGAALLRHFVQEFGAMPTMRVAKTGYGMGAKAFIGALNAVRAFWGESVGEHADAASQSNDAVAELRCNLDDMTGEAIAHAAQTLLAAGALDVFTVPAQMKKGRPGVLLTCLCAPAEAERFAKLMLVHTSSFGVRKTLCERYILTREFTEQQTRLGSVRIKRGRGYGVGKSKPEYEDVAALAEKNGVSFMKTANDILKEV